MLKENKLRLKTLSLLLILSINLSCRERNSSVSHNEMPLQGAWSYIENDSVYGEIICTPDFYWTYTEGGGPRFLPYEIQNDSIKTPFLHAELHRVNRNEFLLLGDRVKVRLMRVPIKIDTAQLIQGNDSAIHNYYFGEFLERKERWKNQLNLK